MCISLICIWYFLYSEEGFQLQTMNMPYPSKEVFLVAPNIPGDPTYVDMFSDTSFSATGTFQNTLYKSAYTHADAQAACVALGATLATKSQLATATTLGANWCVAGWVSDDSSKTYAPTQKICPNTTKGTTAYGATSSGSGGNKTLRVFQSPATAYPICWGVKPAEPAVNVRAFNKLDYNMVGTDLLNSVMNGASTDLFPMTFTPDEARYALEQTNYNIGAPDGANPAREYLIANIAGSGPNNTDTKIYKTDPDYSDDMTQSAADACTTLATTRTKFHDQFNSLRKVFSDVSGAVVSMLGAKNENSYFAAKLQDICSQETPESSPACMKLATLDFSLLYGTTGPGRNLLQIAEGSAAGSNGGEFQIADTSTSRLAALEALNTFKFAREGELCQAYGRIATIEGYIGCTSASASYGSGPIAECAYKSVGSDLPLALEMIGLDVNAEEFLKLRLKEISPYFATSNYYKLVNGILNQLSLTLRLPSLNDFATSNQNFKETQTRIDAIQSYFNISGTN